MTDKYWPSANYWLSNICMKYNLDFTMECQNLISRAGRLYTPKCLYDVCLMSV